MRNMYRKATADDCRIVYDLICDMENTALDYEKFSAIFRAQCENENYYCLICEKEKTSDNEKVSKAESNCNNDVQVAGMLNLRFEDQLHHADRIAEIMEFVVAPGCRNKGFGSEILAKACEVARKHGCIQIEVACNQLRKDTHRFYLREGMKNYHFKFSMSLTGAPDTGNRLGR